MTRDESLEATALVQDTGVMIVSLGLSRAAHAALVQLIPALKAPVAPGQLLPLALVFVAAWVFAAERAGIHRLEALTGPPAERARRILLTQGWAVAAATLILVASQTAVNRSLLGLFFGLSTALLLLASAWQRRFVARLRGTSRVLIAGAMSGQDIAEIEMARGRRAVWEPAVDIARFAARLRVEAIDEIMIAGSVVPDDVRGLVELAAAHGLSALVPLTGGIDAVVGSDLPPPRVQAVGRAHVLVYARSAPRAAAVLVKTLADRLLAAALLIVLAPVLAAIAVAVRLRLGTPVLFLQRRAGFHGRPFWMFKFRTMRVGAEAEQPALRARNQMDGPVFKLADDPRVTPLGRFLRRSSLDELPQLLNVLAGDMSLVGPRPLPLEETALLQGGHRRRLSMRPGLTCLWQVSGRNDLSFGEWMALDLDYVDGWSLGLDAAILLRTIPAIVSGRGAR
ncbi:MAG: exopolysaccharide biosynthesis polyprenyl glycosylphosphotransferase [Polyangia bacterium]